MRKNIICALIAAAVVLISFGVIAYRNFDRSEALVACVYSDGELVREIDLNDVNEPYSFTVEYDGGYNIIDVQKGSIGVTEASCPDKICVNTGRICSGAYPVVCLPNKLVIEIKEGGAPDAAVW